MKVNKPISKKEIFDFLYPNHVHLLIVLTNATDINNFKSEDDNIEDYLEYNFGYDEEIIPKAVNIINGYFRLFKHGEIDTRYLDDDGDNESTNNNLYKNLIIGNNDRDYYVIRHNL